MSVLHCEASAADGPSSLAHSPNKGCRRAPASAQPSSSSSLPCCCLLGSPSPPQQHPYPPPVPSSSCVALGRLGRKLRYKVVVAWVLPPLSCLTPFSTWSLSPRSSLVAELAPGEEERMDIMAWRGERRDSPWVLVLLPSFLFAPKDARPSGTPLNATYHVRPVFWGDKKVCVSRGWGRERRLFSSIKSLPRCLSFFAVSNERRRIESVKRGFGCFCHLPPLLFDFFCDAWSEFTRPPHFALCPPPPASLSRRHSQSSTSLFGARRLGNIFWPPVFLPISLCSHAFAIRGEREGGGSLGCPL